MIVSELIKMLESCDQTKVVRFVDFFEGSVSPCNAEITDVEEDDWEVLLRPE